MKKTSIFYGGGIPVGRNTCKESTGAPLQGDPRHDLIARHRAEEEDLRLSEEERAKVIEEVDRKAYVRITESEVTLDGQVLKLKPSRLAFYILVATHPEGISKGQIHERYLDDYQDIFYVIDRKRAERKGKLMSFELDKEASKYVAEINNGIKQIEEETGLVLASCKIMGDPMRIYARVANLMGMHSLKEL